MVCPRFVLYDGRVSENDMEVLCACGCNVAQRTPLEARPPFMFRDFVLKYEPRSAFANYLRRTWVPTFDGFSKYTEHKETLARLQRNWDMVCNKQAIPSNYQDYADYGGDDEEVRQAIMSKLQQEAQEWARVDKFWDHSRLVEMCHGWSPLAKDSSSDDSDEE